MNKGRHHARETIRGLDQISGKREMLSLGEVVEVSYPHVRIKPFGVSASGVEYSAGDQFLATMIGVEPLVGDRVLIAEVGGEPVVLQIVAPSVPASREVWGFVEDDVGGSYFDGDSQNSATVASNSSNSTREANVQKDFSLPTGTWTVSVLGMGLYAHSSAAGFVGHRISIDGNVGGEISFRVNADSSGSGIKLSQPCWHSRSGRSGTCSVQMEYRPTASSTTAYAGGGILYLSAYRTA
jgi:hypothetical protein